MRAEPAPLRTTFSTGQPMFTSKRSVLGLRLRHSSAAIAILSGSLPNTWVPVNGQLPYIRYSSLRGLCIMALSETISV